MELTGQLHAFATLPPRTKPQYQSNRRFDGLQSYTGRSRDKKNLLPCQESYPTPSSPQPSHHTDYIGSSRWCWILVK